jgi:transposase InsO family protein
VWVPHHVRDELVDFVRRWATRTELPIGRFTDWLGLARGKFFAWQDRYGRENRHNGSVPRDHWLEDWERAAILDFHDKFPLEGYRRLAYMMLDADVVAVSPSSVYRVLRAAGVLDRQPVGHSLKGTGFVQPERPHAHWHIDIAYLNLAGTFYYFCAVLDGFSRFIVHWEIRESMREAEIELILQRAREKYPDAKPRVISDNGPQFIAREFKQFIRLAGMTHVRTAPYYPQSNGKIEAFHKTLKTTTIRPKAPASLDEAQRVVTRFVDHYNQVRLHSSLGYIAPADQLAGRAAEIQAARDRKLEAARAQRKAKRDRLDPAPTTRPAGQPEPPISDPINGSPAAEALG